MDADNTASPVRSRRRLVWAAPAMGAVVVAAAVAVPLVASASPSLPPKTPAQLLVAVSKSVGTPLSGTVVETARLGLPALPDTGSTSISPAALVTGSHTIKVWYDGADKGRLAIVGSLAETDLVMNGKDTWLWSSGKNTAEHWVATDRAGRGEKGATSQDGMAVSMTPAQAAAKALASIDPSTKVSVDGTASVAGRSAYELVLEPRDTRSLVGSVTIAVDAATGVPLRVRVLAAGSTGRPAFETAFESVTFARPGGGVFRFSPPPGAEVTEPKTPAPRGVDKADGTTSGADSSGGSGADHNGPKVTGSGWTSVLEMRGVTMAGAGSGAQSTSSAPAELETLRRAMTPVGGAYGKGSVLKTRLVSVLLLDDGRVFVGAVAPQVLEQAAAQASPAAAK